MSTSDSEVPSQPFQKPPVEVDANRVGLEVESGPSPSGAEPPVPTVPGAVADAGSDAPPAPRRRVVLVAFHGMGVHLPMAAMQDALIQLKAVLGSDLKSFRPVSFAVDGQHYTQVEAETTDTSYRIAEAYYSPFFKGLTNVADVLAFLASAGWKAIFGERKLRRTFCGKVYEFEPAKGTRRALMLALAILLSILILNAFFAASATQSVMQGARIGTTHAVAKWGMAIVVALGALLAILLAVCTKKPRAGLASVAYGVFLILCLSLPAVSLSLAAAHVPQWSRLWEWVPAVNSTWFWVAGLVFAAASLFVRSFFDGYVGDVTAYVGGYGSSKFFQARRNVAARVDRVMNAVTRGGCDHLVVMAHSLGTVVAYDALNRFLLPQGVPTDPNPDPGNDADKVRQITFLTYGSPLDKIAYLFRSESGSRDDLRNDLVASRQPLTCPGSLPCPFRWINVYAKHDIIAGTLEYFDNGTDRRVENRLDAENVVPLACHSHYSAHRALKEALRDALDG